MMTFFLLELHRSLTILQLLLSVMQKAIKEIRQLLMKMADMYIELLKSRMPKALKILMRSLGTWTVMSWLP